LTVSANTERREEVEARNAAACPVVQAIDRVGTPWRLNVVYALGDGELRFNGIKRATGARSKTLSEALDELVEADVVTRRMEEDAPVAVYYGLTAKGEDLLSVLSELDDWARRWGGEPPDGPDARLRDPGAGRDGDPSAQ
jgi:DNA-binding HxlR family transcriptional regulator